MNDHVYNLFQQKRLKAHHKFERQDCKNLPPLKNSEKQNKNPL
jgi:hypothetical protein